MKFSIFILSMKRLIIFFIFQFFISCSTRYQPEGFTGGYEELQLSENMFSVSFRGNGYTRKQKAIDYCLLRCAELAQENGFSYFSIVDQRNDTRNSTYTSPGTSYTTGTVNSYGNISANTTSYGGQTYNISKPTTSNTIVCYKSKPNGGIVYSSKFLLSSIKRKYGIDNDYEKSFESTQKNSFQDSGYTNGVPKKSPQIINRNQSYSKSELLRKYINKEITKEEYSKLMKASND